MICGFMCFYLTSLARYKSSSVWNYYLESHGFYFSSDFLGNDVKNVDTLWDGNSVHFNLKNSINDSLVTEYDIRYNVTCEVLSDIPATCNLNGTNNSTFTGVLSSNARCINDIDDTDVSSFNKTECEIKGYSWQNLVANQDIYFDIVPTEGYELNNVDVSIVVNSVSPYKKSISGTFSLFKNSWFEFFSLVKFFIFYFLVCLLRSLFTKFNFFEFFFLFYRFILQMLNLHYL